MIRSVAAYFPSLSLICITAFAPLAAGCGIEGGLGQAVVADDCAAADSKCSRGGFDKPIAVGGSIHPEVAFKLRSAGAPSMHFQAADETVLRTENGTVEGLKAGMSAVLVISDDGTVLDLFHVWVKDPTGIEIQALRGERTEHVSGRVELFPGESLRLETAVNGDGQLLGGELGQDWVLEKPADKGSPIAQLLEEGSPGKRRLVALEPGETKLTIHAGKAYAELQVVVRGTPKASRVASAEAVR